MLNTHAIRNRFGRLAGARLAARRANRPASPAAPFERLEDRRLMAATTPIITEFLASNGSDIEDQDGQRSDWIEIYNPTAADVNLGGYFLTDDAADLDKWRIPDTTLRSNGYLIVWASGKDRAVAGSELHTNFNIAAAGEYLALVAPDGVTPVSAFSPSFPAQGTDISYGVTVTQDVDALIGPRATARTRIPTAIDNVTAWTAREFTDTSWTLGTTGVGYETDSPPPPVPGFRTRLVDVGEGTRTDINTINDAVSILDSADGTAGGAYVVESDTTVVKTVINMGSGGEFGGDQPLPGQTTANSSLELYALRANADVVIPAGNWTINVNSDDGFRLRIPGVTFLNVTNGQPASADAFEFPSPRGPANTFATFTVPAGGLTTTLQLDFYENRVGDSVELSVAQGHRTTFSTSTFGLLGNTVHGWGVWDPNTVSPGSYRPLIGTDVRTAMYNVNPSAFVRVPFGVANANDYDTLRLQMKYDDGFVAYINDVEVARRNAPASLPYNAQATASRPDDQAVIYESISIPATALRTGSNVLAIHALNAAANSTDLLVYPELQGFSTTVGTDAGFFAQPTPGAANSTLASEGVVADTKFSVDRGFFDAPFQLEITTATPGATIRYTTDGTEPTATTGSVYAGPITVSRTTTLRAAAYKANFVPSNTDTQTYLFLEDVIRQPATAPNPAWPAPGRVGDNQLIDYGMDPDVVNVNPTAVKDALAAIPTFSLVLDADDLFNASRDPAVGGIYANPRGDGRPWERRASVELMYPDGTTEGFQIDAGLRIRGGFSRSGDNPKHAFRLFFRNEYDGDLKFPMFGPDGNDSFDGFDLRTFQNYSWSFGGDPSGIFMRDQLNRDLQLAMGQDGERGDFYHLYINGQYWGLYNSAERPEANHGADYFGGDPEDYDVIKVDPDLGYNIEATDGNMDAWNQLYTLLRGNNLAPVTEDVLQRVQGNNPDGTRNPAYPVLLDVDNLIDYMLVIYWGGNKDAPISDFISNSSPNNFFALRNRTGDEGFRFYVHDAEHTMLPWEAGRNRLGPTPGQGWEAGSQGVGKSNPQWFFQRLWHLPTFKTQVADHVQKHMVNPNGVLFPNRVQTALSRRTAEIDRAVIAESARWGDSKRTTPLTRVDWLNAVGQVQNWVSGRTGTVLQQLRDWGLFPTLEAPRFGQFGGQVPVGYQLNLGTPGAPAGTSIYYTLDGTDPRNRDGSVRGTLYTGPITISDTTRVRTRALNGSTWSALNEAVFTIDLAAVRITEVMYHPIAGPGFDKDEFEFVEVMNTGPTQRNLTGVEIAGGITFTFPDNFRLAPGARAVVVRNLAAFQSRYGTGVNVAGVFGGQLANSEAPLRLESATGQVSLNFAYDDDWHPQTDGGGYSLNIVNPAGPAANWNAKSGWVASNRLHGTPGAPDDGPAAGSVIVNEVVTTPEAGDAGGDFIELRNTTNAPINLSGWFLSDSAADLQKFQIPADTTIGANGYLVFRQAQLGFDIPSTPGEVFLSAVDPAGNLGGYRESGRVGVGEAGFSFGQHVKSTGGTDFVALAAPTPGSANGAPRVGPVVINEIMYYPTAGRAEYVELYNLTGSDVPLHDATTGAAWKFVDGIDFPFPAGARVPAFGYALVVSVDPVVFRSQYDVPPGVPIFGPYQRADGTNVLANDGENLTLYRPTASGADALVDRVNYTAAAPWPLGAANTDMSIVRLDSRTYGNDPAAWDLDVPLGTPGRVNFDGDWPLADIADVSPDPRTTPVDEVTIVFSEPVRGFELSDLRLTRDGGPDLLDGAQALTTTDNTTWTLTGLAGLTGAAGTYSVSIVFGANIVDWAGWPVSGQVSDTWRVGGAPAGRVVGRHVFYNGSAYDGLSLATGAADDGAIASGKEALLPGGAARFVNYTSYTRGINGVMVDVAGLLADLTAADFTFEVGNDADPGAWRDAPAPLAVTRRAGAGVNGSDRLTITWADGAIKNTWLRVTVLANGRTGLPSADVFYFGNLVGEVGDNAASAIVTAADVLAVRSAMAAPSVPALHVADFNRDGRVNTIDMAVVRAAAGGSSLTLITAPTPVAATAAVATTAAPAGTTTATAPAGDSSATTSSTTTSSGASAAGTTATPAAAPVPPPPTRTQPARRAPASRPTPFSQTAIASSSLERRRRDSLVVADDDVLGSGR